MKSLLLNNMKLLYQLMLLAIIIDLINSQQFAQPCQLQIYSLYYKNTCNILFRNCDNAFGFKFHSCQKQYCVSYSYNSDSNSYSCDGYAWQVLLQSQCTNDCCINHSSNSFTSESLKACKKNQDQAWGDTGRIVGIVFGSIGAAIFVFLFGLCCYKTCDGGHVCCDFFGCIGQCGKRTCQCCTNIFCCCFKGEPIQKNEKYGENPNNTNYQLNENNNMVVVSYGQIPKNAYYNEKDGQLPWLNNYSSMISQYDKCEACLEPQPQLITYCLHKYHIICLINRVQKNGKCQACSNNVQGIIKIICLNCKTMYKQMTFIPNITTEKQIRSKVGSFKCYNCQ